MIRSSVLSQGKKLEVSLYPNEENDVLVLLVHGFSGGSSNPLYLKLCESLQKDYPVLRFDFRGQGESEGEFFESSISLELEDLGVITNYARSELGYQKYILLAHSFGAVIAQLYAQRDSNVQGIISLSGEGDLQKAITYEFDETQMKSFKEEGRALYENWTYDGEKQWLGVQFLEDMKAYSNTEAVKNLVIPQLFIHGTEDDVIPHKASEEMFHLSTAKYKELVLMPDVDHMYGVYTEASSLDDLLNVIRQWLDKNYRL